MQYYNCPVPYSEERIWKDLSARDLELLHCDRDEKKLVFRPVTTATEVPVRVAFVGMNAYCKETDFREASRQINFMIWVQATDRYPKIDRWFAMMRLYLDGLSVAQDYAAYVTNFVKVIPPEEHFTESKEMCALLNGSDSLRALCEDLLLEEIEGMARSGCRHWVCCGDDVWRYVKKLLKRRYSWCSSLRYPEDRVWRCVLGEQSILIMRQTHPSFRGSDHELKEKTERLVGDVQKASNLIWRTTPSETRPPDALPWFDDF